MSLLKSESYWHGVLVALFFAMTVSVMTAFVMTESATAFTPEGMRLWKPYQPEQFGGQRRDADGVYGSIDAIHWKVSALKGIPAMETVPTYKLQEFLSFRQYYYLDGEEQYSFQNQNAIDGNINFLDTINGTPEANEVNVSGLLVDRIDSKFGLGTRITVGNRQGHWGWQFRGYHLPDISGSESRLSITQASQTEVQSLLLTTLYRNTSDIRYLRNALSNTSNVIDLELSATYRTHPFRWGSMEFLAGARYWDFEDSLQYEQKGASFFYDSGWSAQSNEDAELSALYAVYGLKSRTVRNRIVGPQFGMSVSRRNARWTFGADATFIAGVNNLSYSYNEFSILAPLTVEENADNNNDSNQVTPLYIITHPSVLSDEVVFDQLLQLDGSTLSGNNFDTTDLRRYYKRKTVFSPGIDLQLSAKWQWTDAVGFKLGFNSSIFNHVARSSDIKVITDSYSYYNETNTSDTGVVEPAGNRTDRTRSTVTDIGRSSNTVTAYGISFGIEIRR
ncbi:hypothetical protein FACS189427_07700 [Planctomycetales bacterium]|nr:hypothetical protein FACS189427_07700 [Planctomycetales bacterium]